MLRLQPCLETRVNDYFMVLETWPIHSDTRQEHMILSTAKSVCEWTASVSLLHAVWPCCTVEWHSVQKAPC